MRVIGVCGASGMGKTTLLEGVIAGLRAAGQRVSVIKHAHHRFDIDHPGKDSWRHRQAGAGEVLVANSHRLALMREFAQPQVLDPHVLIAELSPCDWVLVEGFKHEDLPKVEVWRDGVGPAGREPLFLHDPQVVAVITDDPASLPEVPRVPVLDLNEPALLVRHLLASGERYLYHPPHHG
ncbi:molybdopterin-guanine dinucleotide biosynthesis protein B [Ideonella sp. B7]|uniref:molybdopterin-guanine dinucleotide biosynthesis protein B n=1 Tax=Ideonella benzenivorans TaxID=2831643 RepID=UPI001CED14E8|nr:molybdopterin-guanine dinucleotide biosynthesis protein B [Ideonella benzenivorans]MCA6216469.1 molybdopterin-guanine dinucleotide biosynthesis protein B [Ideonella benzenivorans]